MMRKSLGKRIVALLLGAVLLVPSSVPALAAGSGESGSASAVSTSAGDANAKGADVQSFETSGAVDDAAKADSIADESKSLKPTAVETDGRTESDGDLYPVTASGFANDAYELTAQQIVDKDTLRRFQSALSGRTIVLPYEISPKSGTMSDPSEGVSVTLSFRDQKTGETANSYASAKTAWYNSLDPATVGLFHFTDAEQISSDSAETLSFTRDEASQTITFQTKSFSPFVFATLTDAEQAEQAEQEKEQAENATETSGTTAKAARRAAAATDGTDADAESTGVSAKIDSFTAQFVSGATLNDKGDHVWAAENDAENHPFLYQVNYTTNGEGEFAAGQFQLTIPKRLLRDRERNFADHYVMSLPRDDEQGLTDENVLVYKEDGDDIVVYNRLPMGATQNAQIQIQYETSKETWEYADYGKKDDQGNLIASSDTFTATLSVPGQETVSADAPAVYIDTYAKILSTEKLYPTFYTSWQDSFGTEVKPSNSDDYWYIMWTIRSRVSANQPYNYTITDDFSDAKDLDGEVVGYRYAEEGTFTPQHSVENIKREYTGTSYRRDYVLTKISKSKADAGLEEDGYVSWTVKNYATVTVDPIDQADSDTSATDSETYFYEKKNFYEPTGSFQVAKDGLDYRGWLVRDSNDLAVMDEAVTNFADGSSDTLGSFNYRLYMDGFPYPWTRAADTESNDPTAYGKEKVTYQLVDEDVELADVGGTNKIALQAGDYQFTGLDLSFRAHDATYDDTKKAFVANTAEVTADDDKLTIYVKTSDGGDYTEAGTFSPKNSQVHICV